MNWDNDELRAAALRLLLTGRVRASRRIEPLLVDLEDLGLVAPGGHVGEFVLQAQYSGKLYELLAKRWPDLKEAEQVFASHPKDLCALSLRELRRSQLKLPAGITQLNRRTWSAWAGAHSKSGFAGPPDGVVLTTDGVLRMRANTGLRFAGKRHTLEASTCEALFGETIVPERGLGRGWRVEGKMPDAILTVENIGAYIDLCLPSWLLLVHAPGRDTALATRFIGFLPPDIPWIHFGDLDPAGLRIASTIHSQADGRRPMPWIPQSSIQLLDTHSLPLAYPWPQDVLPPLLLRTPILSSLVDRQHWIEHESMVLLPSFIQELTQLARHLRRTRAHV